MSALRHFWNRELNVHLDGKPVPSTVVLDEDANSPLLDISIEAEDSVEHIEVEVRQWRSWFFYPISYKRGEVESFDLALRIEREERPADDSPDLLKQALVHIAALTGAKPDAVSQSPTPESAKPPQSEPDARSFKTFKGMLALDPGARRGRVVELSVKPPTVDGVNRPLARSAKLTLVILPRWMAALALLLVLGIVVCVVVSDLPRIFDDQTYLGTLAAIVGSAYLLPILGGIAAWWSAFFRKITRFPLVQDVALHMLRPVWCFAFMIALTYPAVRPPIEIIKNETASTVTLDQKKLEPGAELVRFAPRWPFEEKLSKGPNCTTALERDTDPAEDDDKVFPGLHTKLVCASRLVDVPFRAKGLELEQCPSNAGSCTTWQEAASESGGSSFRPTLAAGADALLGREGDDGGSKDASNAQDGGDEGSAVIEYISTRATDSAVIERLRFSAGCDGRTLAARSELCMSLLEKPATIAPGFLAYDVPGFEWNVFDWERRAEGDRPGQLIGRLACPAFHGPSERLELYLGSASATVLSARRPAHETEAERSEREESSWRRAPDRTVPEGQPDIVGLCVVEQDDAIRPFERVRIEADEIPILIPPWLASDDFTDYLDIVLARKAKETVHAKNCLPGADRLMRFVIPINVKALRRVQCGRRSQANAAKGGAVIDDAQCDVWKSSQEQPERRAEEAWICAPEKVEEVLEAECVPASGSDAKPGPVRDIAVDGARLTVACPGRPLSQCEATPGLCVRSLNDCQPVLNCNGPLGPPIESERCGANVGGQVHECPNGR